MGLNPDDAASAAMSVACSYVRRYPKLVYWMAVGDPEAAQVLVRLRDQRAIKRWLRHAAAFRRWEQVLADLIDKADTFVNHNGQAGRLMETYRQQRDTGKLDDLSPSARAVHRAVFSLGVYNGAPVLASLRYVETAVRAQSAGTISLSPAAVQKHIKNLVKLKLFLDYDPGYRGVRAGAGRVALELTPVASEPDVDLVLNLSLSADQQLALCDYVAASKERQSRTRAEIQKRRADMVHMVVKPFLGELIGMTFEDDLWTEFLSPIGERVHVPPSENGIVFMADGAKIDLQFALGLRHFGGCESDYLPPLLCSCVSAQVELAEEW